MQPTEPRLRRVISTFASYEQQEQTERREWRAMSPLERLCAVETMRQLNHPQYDPATHRLQRFYTVA